MTFVCLLLPLLVALVHGVPIDNGILDPIEIGCASDSVTISFNTEKPWQGILFVKNFFDNQGCKTVTDGSSTATIFLPFDGPCGLKRERSVEPRGVFVWTTVIMSFHPRFVTKVDRAVRVECFYMEADKTVDQDIEVSALTTVEESSQVPMPVCRYEILDGVDGSGGEVRFAFVGQKIYHKWTCESDHPDTFCMSVYNCYVDDGSGDRVILLDQSGCALDVHLLDRLEYQTDLMAGQTAHVFKYADRSSLYFNCQIRIDVKDPGEACRRPQCAAPGGLGVIGAGQTDGYGGVQTGGQTDGGGGTVVRPSEGRPSSPSAQYGDSTPSVSPNVDPTNNGSYNGINYNLFASQSRVKRYSKMTMAGDKMVELERYTPMMGAASAVMDVSVPYAILVGDVDLTPDDVLPSLLAHRAEWQNERLVASNVAAREHGGQTEHNRVYDNEERIVSLEREYSAERDSLRRIERGNLNGEEGEEEVDRSTVVMLVAASGLLTAALLTVVLVVYLRSHSSSSTHRAFI